MRDVWFSWGKADIAASLRNIDQSLGAIVATLKEILNNIGGWGIAWRERAIAAEASAAAERARADAAVAHADAVVADDAAQDIAQLAEARAAAEAEAQAKYDELVALDTPATEPPVEEPTDTPEG